MTSRPMPSPGIRAMWRARLAAMVERSTAGQLGDVEMRFRSSRFGSWVIYPPKDLRTTHAGVKVGLPLRVRHPTSDELVPPRSGCRAADNLDSVAQDVGYFPANWPTRGMASRGTRGAENHGTGWRCICRHVDVANPSFVPNFSTLLFTQTKGKLSPPHRYPEDNMPGA